MNIDRFTLKAWRALFGMLAVVLLLAAPGARASNLVAVHAGALPALEGQAPAASLLSVDGRLLAIGGRSAFMLNPGRDGWQELAWTGPAIVASSAGEHDTYVLGGDRAGAALEVLRLNLRDGALAADRLPALPFVLEHARLALLGDQLYVAGNDRSGAARLLALERKAAGGKWQAALPWPGEQGEVTSLVGQNARLLVTLRGAAGRADRMLAWKDKEGWRELAAPAGQVIGGAVRATGQAHVLYLLRPAGGSTPELWSYHTITASWAKQGAAAGAGAGPAAGWGNGVAWSNGAAFSYLELATDKRLLKPVDWIVIVAYLAGMLGIGWYCYAREKRNSTADFFVGGRKIPFWAAGISLYAANTSSISYIAIPAKAFETNWQYMTNNLIAVVALGFVAVAIVPLLRRLNLMSVFHYLEIRFHPGIRMVASLICILVQIGSRMSVILLLPSLAIATITGIDVTWSILLMGGFTIVYTAMGGMKAVVWTDFVQLIVKMGGALFAIGFIIWKLDGGVAEFVQTSMAANKTKLFDFSWDLTKPTVWGFIFLVIFDVVLTFPKDQVLMQRALSTKSAKEASRSIVTFALISIPGGFIFYTIGTALFAFYKSHPERLNPLLSVDATFPLFIAAELPTGVTGLIIAGILAAAMATLSGIMNSVATLASVDFYEKLVKNRTPKQSVLFAEIATVATGVIGIVAALWLSRFNSHSLFDVSIELAGLLGGGFAGAYTLGMFTRRANWQGVAFGIAGSTVLTTIAWSMKLVHPYFYLPVSIMLCIGIGYLASYLFPAPTQSLDGLTIYADK
jgi:SSS family transporter